MLNQCTTGRPGFKLKNDDMDAQLIKNLQEVHVAAWNEKDRDLRDGMLKTIYAENVKMYDKDFTLEGIGEVSDFIEKLQKDPAFLFSAAKPIENIQNGARFYGHIRTGEGMLNSMDFFVLDNGKVVHLYAFMDMA
jgi:hypothetical protein